MAGKGPLRLGELEAALVCGNGEHELRVDLDGPGEALNFGEAFGVPLVISEATWEDRAVTGEACGMAVRRSTNLWQTAR